MKKTQTLKDRIYNEIINGIVSGEYKSGQILNEQELVQRYSVSKAPVREALLILSSEGILINIPRYGYQVFSFSMAYVANIMEFRSVTEDYMLAKGFEHLRREDLDELKALINEGTDSSTDVWKHWNLNMAFHLKLASLSDNEYMYNQLRRALGLLKLAYAQFYWSQWNSAEIPNDLRNHGKIVEALESRDLEVARLYLKRDLQDFCMS